MPPRKTVAYNNELLWLLHGLLWGMVACYSGLFGFPGRVDKRPLSWGPRRLSSPHSKVLGPLASRGLPEADKAAANTRTRQGAPQQGPKWRKLPGKPVAYNYRLLWCIVACSFGLLGVPGCLYESAMLLMCLILEVSQLAAK